jgi:competence protein ComGC
MPLLPPPPPPLPPLPPLLLLLLLRVMLLLQVPALDTQRRGEARAAGCAVSVCV